MSKKDRVRAYSAFAAVSLFWGTTYLAIRIGVAVLPPALFAGIRFWLAGAIFMVALLLRGYALPRKQDLLNLTIVAVALLVIANGTVVWAEQFIPSSLAALIVTTLPLCMVLMEAALPRGEKLTLRKVVGILIGFGGVIILLWPDLQGSLDPAYLKGVLIILIAPLSWSAGSIYSKYNKTNTRPLMAAATQMLIAGTILIVVGAVNGEIEKFTFETKGLAALGYLVVFGSMIGYGSFIYALDKLPAAIVSTYAYLNPIVAVILGWLILDERLDWPMVFATVIILSGVVLVKQGSPRLKPVVRPSKVEPELRIGEDGLVTANEE
ncbi:MAG: EamA family transporter [bacterium]